MIGREETLAAIRKELAAAGEAREAGNEGRVRVCARRAAGAAIAFWRQDERGDVLERLRSLHHAEEMPPGVREAAEHLAAKLREDFTPPFDSDPLDDCRVIVDHLLAR